MLLNTLLGGLNERYAAIAKAKAANDNIPDDSSQLVGQADKFDVTSRQQLVDNAQCYLLNTANLIIDLLKKSVNDHEFKKQCKKQAELRLGNQGGGQRIAEEITRLLILSKEKTLN